MDWVQQWRPSWREGWLRSPGKFQYKRIRRQAQGRLSNHGGRAEGSRGSGNRQQVEHNITQTMGHTCVPGGRGALRNSDAKPQVKCRRTERIFSLHSRIVDDRGTVRIQSVGGCFEEGWRTLALESHDLDEHPTSAICYLCDLGQVAEPIFHLQNGNNNISTSKDGPRQHLALRALLLFASCRYRVRGSRPPAAAGISEWSRPTVIRSQN